jgi:outer membrane lipoprotein carrier protein
MSKSLKLLRISRLIFACFVLALASSAHASTSRVEDSLERFFKDVHTYHADFHQVVLDEGLNPLQETSGRMWIERPGKFRWEYDPPYQQLIVGDGERVWVYDIDLEQVTARRMDGALGNTPALLLAGKGNLEGNFTVTSLGKQGALDWVRMIPKRKDGGFEDIRIGFEHGKIRTLELVDAFGQITRIELDNAEENTPIAAKEFQFEPPAGVDVIRADE